jgi:PD-(D/E)XK nuclease superfamily
VNWPLMVDASMLKEFAECREFVRQRYLENRELKAMSIHYAFGVAVHAAVEEFWRGAKYEDALATAFSVTSHYPVGLLNPTALEKWTKLVKGLPQMLEVYYTTIGEPVGLYYSKVRNADGELREGLALELEWSYSFSDKVTLCGRIDRVMQGKSGPQLVDVKTASEIGKDWKEAYRRSMMLQRQFGLYDWYLRQVGPAPERCYLEVLVKPYESKYKEKPARLEIIELEYVTTPTYRARFSQQLSFLLSELVTYFERYSEQKPWPMSGGSACKTIYGECPFLDVCLMGPIPKIMERYQDRSEHLELRKELI